MLDSFEKVDSQKEKFQRSPQIRFEPGDHDTYKGKNDLIIKNVTSGDLNVHTWNPEVAQRISQYPELLTGSPLVLAIDYQTPSVAGYPQFGLNGFDTQEAFDVWFGLPSRPQIMNLNSSDCWVVRGDVAYPNTILPIANISTPKLMSDLKTREQSDEQRSALVSDNFILTGGGILLDLAIVIGIGQKLMVNKQLRISRRQFLKYATTMGGSLALLSIPGGSLIAGGQAAHAPNAQTKEYWIAILEALKPKILKQVIPNGRTGLLFSKEEDAINELDLPNDTAGAVVLGFGHGSEANDLLNNQKKRDDAILNMANELLNALKDVGKNYKDFPLKEAQKALLNYLATTEVVKIHDPGWQSPHTNFIQELPSLFSSRRQFKSQKVVTALTPLINSI